MTTRFLKYLISTTLVLLLSFHWSYASDDEKEHNHETTTKKFDAGPFIIDHVSDSHEWHIVSTKETHYSIPLPIILYSADKGWDFFMSSAFEHGHATHNGYKLETEGDKKGQILAVDAAGTVIGSPIDLSMTRVSLSVIISILMMLVIFTNVAKSYKKRPGKAPRGFQLAIETMVIFVRDDVAKPMIGAKYERYMPFLLTVFFFILINNLMGLVPWIPGGSNVTGNIAVSMVLAVSVFLITNLGSNKNYWVHIFNTPGVPWWLKFPVPLMPLVEFAQVFIRPFILMVRLFANILAGHIIALGFYSLIFIFGSIALGMGYGVSILSVAFNIFMAFLEILVAFIQAFVFTLLAALYFGGSVEEHHSKEEAH